MIIEGIITKQISGFYDVVIGKTIVQCRAKGIFRKNKISPMVGDRVKIDSEERIIVSIESRKNNFIRPAVSNIDYLGIVIAPKEPVYDLLLIDKLIINSLINKIKPFIIINKIDTAETASIDKIENEYSQTGYRVFRTSCKELIGVGNLKENLTDGIVALAGQSGVGKSSILNLLCADACLATGELSARTATGKHTTTHSQLITLPSGAMMIDTPGFSSFEIDGIAPENLQLYYVEFNTFLGKCRFSDCVHENEPDCEVKRQVEEGVLSFERYQRYKFMLRNLINKKE